MSVTKKATEPGTLVTARITDAEGTTHTFHGQVIETVHLLTHAEDNTLPGGATRGLHPVTYHHLPYTPRATDKPAALAAMRWLRIYSATGTAFPVVPTGTWRANTHPLAEPGKDYSFSYSEFWVRIDSDDIDVRVAAKEGKTWIEANLSLDNRRLRLHDRLKALDPRLADEVERLIGDIEDDAFDRGKDYEWRANND